MFPLARWTTSPPARRIPAACQLMAPSTNVVLPLLENNSAEKRFLADDSEALVLAEILVKDGIAVPEDWHKSERDATKYVLLSLQRWLRDHGGAAIDHRFDLNVTLSDRLVDYSDERGPEGTLYLIVDPESAAFVLLNPSIAMLEQVHPRFASTFFSHFVGALNRWVRVYDYRDAEERVEMLREWYEGEENADQYEVPDVEGCTPKCLGERPLGLSALKKLNKEIRSQPVKTLITGLLELCRISGQAKRPEFTDDMGEQLMDSNPALPSMLAAFSSGDAVVGCFDDDGENAMEVTPQPNLIIPLRLSDPASVRQGFRTLAVACNTLAAASRLIDLMPGNEEGVITNAG
jgi:hypothetical protein